MGKIKLEVGKRVLYHVNDGGIGIAEGIIEDISPSGELLKIQGRWYSTKTDLTTSGPVSVDILDEAGAARKGPVTIDQKETKPEVGNRVLYRANGDSMGFSEGTIEDISPGGELVKIQGKWYFTEKKT